MLLGNPKVAMHPQPPSDNPPTPAAISFSPTHAALVAVTFHTPTPPFSHLLAPTCSPTYTCSSPTTILHTRTHTRTHNPHLRPPGLLPQPPRPPLPGMPSPTGRAAQRTASGPAHSRSHTGRHSALCTDIHRQTRSHTQSHILTISPSHSHTQSRSHTDRQTRSHTSRHGHTQTDTVTHRQTWSHTVTQADTVTHGHTSTQAARPSTVRLLLTESTEGGVSSMSLCLSSWQRSGFAKHEDTGAGTCS